MKKIAHILSLIAATFSLGANAASVALNQQQLNRLNEQTAPLLTPLLSMDDGIESKLKSYNTPTQIWLRKSLIEAIGKQTKPTQQQLKWLLTQVDNEQQLKMTLPESGHAQPLVVVNIAAKAKALLAEFRAIEMAQFWQQQLAAGTLTWQTLLEQSVTLRRQKTAWQHFLAKLRPNDFDKISTALLERATANDDIPNLLLLLMARQSQEEQRKSQFYRLLWLKQSDENSIDGLNRLIEDAPLSELVPLLKSAAQNPELTSLAYNLLAKHVGDDIQVQNWLFAKLSEARVNQLAAVALATIDDPQVKQQLLQGRYSPNKMVSQASQLAVTVGAIKESAQ